MAFPQVAKVIVSGARGPKGLKGDAGANLGNVTSNIPTSAVTIDADTLASRVADIRDWAGIDLTGAADCAAIFQDAVDEATAAGLKLILPAGVIKLASPVEIPAGAVIEGASGTYMASGFTGRTVLHFAHTGKGFTVTGATGGRDFRNFATYRTQPNPTGGWAPTAHDWDFYLDGTTDCFFDNILLVNPTKGIIATNGGGRHSFNRVWGHPLSIGIQIDTSYDVTRFTNVHFWNFWTQDSNVTNYTTSNATAIYSKRNDNPDLSNVFGIFYRYGLRIGNWAGGGAGTTSRLRGSNIGFDACGSGLTIDADANGSTVELHAFYAHGNDTNITSGSLIDIQGTNGDTRIYGKVDVSNAHRHAINVAGSGAALTIDDVVTSVYNKANGGYAAVNAASGIFAITVNGEVSIGGGVSSAAAYAGTGRINGVRREYTPTIAPGTGAWTGSASAVFADHFIKNDICEVNFAFTMPTNNTGATAITMTLPVTANATISGDGGGREIAVNGNWFQAFVPASGTSASLLTPTNGYPGVTNGQFRGSFRYRV